MSCVEATLLHKRRVWSVGMATLYLLFEPGGELAGLERGAPIDAQAARCEARRLLSTHLDLAALEIWSGGELVDAVRG